MSQKTGTDYKNAMQTLEPLQGIYAISEEVARCLDRNCFDGLLYSDSSSLSQQASEAIKHLCDAKNDYLLTLENLIVKFLPTPTTDSFETYIAIIRGYLTQIKFSGCSDELQNHLDESIRNLSKELDRINESLSETRPDKYCHVLVSLNQDLYERAFRLSSYRPQCSMLRCGIMGHGNPSIRVQPVAGQLSLHTSQAAGPLLDADQFCREITDGFSACMKEFTDLKHSDPARHPDEALSKLTTFEQIWNQLKTIIQT